MAGRAQEIFEHAVGLQGAAREDYVSSACGTDRALQVEVVALLRIHEQAPRFLASPTAGSDAAATIIGAPREHEGQVIGRYKLLQPIGEGGFGSVWMAEQREPVKRRVAFKIIKLGMDTKQVIARFEAERQALAMMDHPNIAKVLDAGSTETGRPYFVMEYIKGVPILEYCDTERLDTRARLDLFMSVCHAIQHAHQKGIIHRDIKPSNVLITMHDGVPVPKVIDFGIAKATNTELTQKTLFTEHRQMIGTPAYMSPEQAEMSGLDIDTRSDIYSLGVLLYELLTGTTPFATEELLSKGFAEMMRIIREVEPHKPSTRLSSLGETATKTAQQRRSDTKKLGLVLRGDLDWIVMKCLEKDRTRRYETANGLAADIKRHLNDEPVTAGPPSASYRLRKFVKRNRGQVIVVGVLAVALVAAFVGASWGLVQANRASSIRLQQQLENEQRNAADNARLGRNAEAVTALLGQCEEALRAGDRLKARIAIEAAKKRAAEGGAEKDAQRLSRLSADLDLMNDLAAIDQFRWTWTDHGFPGADAVAARERESLKKFGADPEAGSVESAAAAVNASAARDRIVAALDWQLWARRSEDVRAVLRRVDADPFRDDVRDALLAKDTPRMVELVKRPVALEQPPGFATFLGEFKNIDAARRRELLLAAMLRRPSDVGVLFTLHNVAAVSDPVDWNENLRWSHAATAADPTNFAAYANLGVALRETGRPQDAITCTRRAIELDPTSSGAYLNLGNALDMTGQFEEALVSYRKAIELDPKDFENYCCMGRMLSEHGRTEEALEVLKKSIELNPKHAEAHYGMGVTLSRLGRWDEAMGSYLKTIELDPKHAQAYGNIGVTLRNRGRLDEAVGYFEKCLELAPKDAQAETNLAGVLYELGRHDEALVYCKKAVEDDPNHAGAFFNMGKFYAEQGPLEDAIANFRKAIELDPNYAEPHCDLAVVLSGQGDYEGALAEFRRAHELGSKRADWHYPSAEWIRKAEADAARAAKLPAFLNGEYQPSDNAERREFANMCQNKSLNYAATGIFAAVLAADPELGDRLQDPYVRYNAACVAVLSAAGRGKDAAGLSEDERARLRLQALGWLRADLNVAAATLDSGNRVNVLWLMRQFLRQSDLVSIRDPGALAKLPAEEQFAFKKLWDDAAALLKQAETKTPNAAHPESPPAEK